MRHETGLLLRDEPAAGAADDPGNAGGALPLASLTRFLFFTGKGGVGKTSIACATALLAADAGRRTLLVSTDPASNLDDVFGMHAGTAPTPVPGADALWIMNIDPEAAAAAYRERLVGPYRGVLPSAALRSMEEQLSGACTVEIAAFDEFTGLLADPDAIVGFEHVVFDTAPTGHTLRLLSLPTAWSGFIDTNTTGTSCLGPLAGLEGSRARYAEAVRVLADATQTSVVLVSRAERSALREAARAAGELRALGIASQRLVVNGLLGSNDGDAIAARIVASQRDALAGMPEPLAMLPRHDVMLASSDLTGLASLRRFAAAEWAHDAPADVHAWPSSHAALQSLVSDDALSDADGGAAGWEASRVDLGAFPRLGQLVERLASAEHGAIMTMGKGGVGKTTIATALALGLARSGRRVHLTTTDPAAHVEHAVREAAGGSHPPTLTVSRIDPAVETRRYAAEVLAAAEPMEPEERALLEEDLRSPCTEEIAVFRAFARVVDEASDAFVVLDTAPTGHTLLLLDAAESYHREVARTAGSHIPESVRALLPRLRDPGFTRVLLVTLAETTPVRESERLQDDLRRAGIEPFGWVLNASLAGSQSTHPVLAARARLEPPIIERVATALSPRTWLVPWNGGLSA